MNLPKLPYLAIAKKAVNVVVGAGASKIVKGIIENNTDPSKLTDKVAIVGATFVVGAMVSDATSKYTDAKIDDLASWWNENVSKKFTDEEETPEIETLTSAVEAE